MWKRLFKDIEPKSNPLDRPDYTEADVQAIRALAVGAATPDQQKRALRWMIMAFGTYDVSFRRGGLNAQRDTDFAQGKQYAGQILVWMIKAAESNTDPDKISIRRLGEQYGHEQSTE